MSQPPITVLDAANCIDPALINDVERSLAALGADDSMEVSPPLLPVVLPTTPPPPVVGDARVSSPLSSSPAVIRQPHLMSDIGECSGLEYFQLD